MSSTGAREPGASPNGRDRARARWWRRPPAILLLVLAIGAAAAVARRGSSPSPVAVEDGTREAPQFVLPDLVEPGGVVRLADHRGTPVVLNFWASWCVPCREEMPVLARVSDEFAREVAFLGVDHQDGRDDALALLGEAGVRYASGFDPDGTTASSFGLRGMPTTVFIGVNGEVLATSLGELTESELRTAIVDLFGIADD